VSNEVQAACYGDSLRIGPKRDSYWWGAAPLDAGIVAFDYDRACDFLGDEPPVRGRAAIGGIGGQPLITDGALDVTARPSWPVGRPIAEN
jgi:hypothetical protein